MSIAPPSDILMDVAQAADPRAAMAAAERLRRPQAAAGASESFARSLAASAAPRPAPNFSWPVHARAAAEPQSAATKAAKGLEEFFLKSVVETMLPRGEAAFGAGAAGDAWRSMLADQLAHQLGGSIDLGIARQAGARLAAQGRAAVGGGKEG